MPEVYQGESPNSRLLAGALASSPKAAGRLGNAFSVSLATHIAAVLLVLFVLSLPGVPIPSTPESLSLRNVIWTAQPGPGGGGGGGGNKTPEPPRKAELPDKQKVTVPAAQPPKMQAPEPPKPEQINVPAQPVASGVQELPGAISQVTSPSLSQGIGSGGGAGTGTGTGIGSGQGSGLGPGYGGGFGGGAYRPGNGVTSPQLIREVKPTYTADAMRAKIQGVVWLEAVVMENGSVGQVRVTRSLDPTFGLDQEAEKTVKKWLFRPGMRLGQPVAVMIEIEMSFTLR
jgi:periplasmic protein TonB